VLAHELGHVLGIGHPRGKNGYIIDNDANHAVDSYIAINPTDVCAGYGARFRQECTLEDAIGSHACSL
jgi:hypothetical protein